MNIKNFKTGYDTLNHSWYILFELESGARLIDGYSRTSWSI